MPPRSKAPTSRSVSRRGPVGSRSRLRQRASNGAQTDWLLAGLQLQAVAGQLSAADLENIDRRVAPVSSEAK